MVVGSVQWLWDDYGGCDGVEWMWWGGGELVGVVAEYSTISASPVHGDALWRIIVVRPHAARH